MNVLTLLRQDHATLRSFFSQFDRTSKTAYDQRSELFLQIRRDLQIHSKAEEEIFYPAIKAMNSEGQRLASEAIRQHMNIDQLLTQLSRLKSSDRNFDETFETLIDTVDHHIEVEEEEILRFAEKNCSEQQLEELGRQTEDQKRIIDDRLAA
jgi:hemerythrin superfamily protein